MGVPIPRTHKRVCVADPQVCPVDTKGKLTNDVDADNGPTDVRGRDGLYDPVVHSSRNEGSRRNRVDKNKVLVRRACRACKRSP